MVLGHSLGGKVAMLLALRHPDLLAGLIIEDIAPLNSSTSEFEHLLGPFLKLDLTDISSRRDAHAKLKTDIDNTGVRGFCSRTWSVMRTADLSGNRICRCSHDRVTHQSWASRKSTRPSRDHPVLWIKGENSDYITDEATVEMRKLFPMTRKIQIRDASHWVHSEQSKIFTDTIDYYIAGRYDESDD